MDRIALAWLILVVASSLPACKKQAESAPEAMGGSSMVDGEEVGEATSVACESNRECDDGAFCNGTEQCVDGFCHLGVAPSCDDGIDCTEDSCSHTTNSCIFTAPDADGDGHADAGCAGPAGEPLGDDCDDEDPTRFPGNTESCTLDDPTHDEDCNPNTFGYLDEDEDGAVSSECCNESDDGDICGDDCDDTSFSRYPDHPEICDNIDNNCDGEVDVNTKEVYWYPDADGDHYGAIDSDGVLDCSPVEGHALRATDCDDSSAAVHAAALELCDGVDNDCDGEVDEDGVCACAPEGNARACACLDGNTGVQSCVGGLWGSCDCTECVTGTTDCLGDLLPRTCVAGRWVVESACTGIRPICLAGSCVCSDGTDNCEDIDDIVPPAIVASSPGEGEANVSPDAVLAAVFTEDLMSATVSELSVTLRDALGNVISGTVGFGGSSILFTPDAPLSPGLDFEWRLEGGISDIAGNTMGGRQTIHFSTAVATVSTALGNPPTITYDDAVLAVSRNGTAKIAATRTDGIGDSFIVEGTKELAWSGSAWTESGHISDEADVPRGLTVDNQGWAVATRRDNAIVYKYDLTSTPWTWDETPLSSTDDGTPAPVVMGNAGGDVVIATRNEGDMQATMRDSAGSYTTNVAAAVASPFFLAGDISENRQAILVWDQSSSLHVWRTTSAMASWTKAPVIDGSIETIKDAAVIMAEDDVATVAWVQSLGDIGLPYDQIQIQDVNTSAVWNGTAEFVDGAFKEAYESDPRLGNDDSGNTHLIYVHAGQTVHWLMRSAGMNWTSAMPISITHAGAIQDLDLQVAANGVAYAIWIDKAYDDLWGALYDPSSGWEPPQRLEDTNARVTEAQVKVDAAGNAHVIYRADEWFAIQLAAP